MLKYLLLVSGIVVYFFSIDSLITTIKQETFSKSFVSLMDTNNDGVITGKQIKAFKPCPEYKGKKIKKIFNKFGKKADLNQFSQMITRKQIHNALKPCINIKHLNKLISLSYIQSLSKDKLIQQFFSTYDIDNNKQITYGEYQIVNSFIKKSKKIPDYLEKIFEFFDKNHDWKISEKEMMKAKIKFVEEFVKDGKRK